MTRSASFKAPIVFLAIASSEVERTRDLKALEQEHRVLQEQYENAQHEGRCQLVDRFAVTLDGFFDVFRDSANAGRIKVLHFAGHADDGMLVMETEGGQKKLAGAAGLAEFLSTKPGLHLVFLNGCHTQAQIANLHSVGIPVVIATTEEVDDEQARIFACNFHDEFSKGSSIETAFRSARGALRAARHGNSGASDQWILSAPNEKDKQWSLVSDRQAIAPCRMLFPKNEEFVGREADLEGLHRALLRNSAVGIRPAVLTGLGGIGKTQLAVEYCYLHQSSYPAGIFWINAAQNWSEQFAELGMLLVPGLAGEPQIRQVQAAADYFRTHHDCLLVIDNVADPAQLRRTITPDLVPSSLPCHLLFTTRRRDLRDMSAVEVTFLPLDPALRLLLRADSRRSVLDLDHSEHADACAIYRMLGGLPLALEIAGAFLAEWPEISVSDFRQRLHREGRLATLDEEGEELSSANLSGIHEAAVSATLGEQWDALGTGKQVDQDARLILLTASQLVEAAVIPAARLGIFAGLEDENVTARPGRLERALRRLERASLIEELRDNELRLHPLVHEFAGLQIAPTEQRSFRHMCAPAVDELPARHQLGGALHETWGGCCSAGSESCS